MAELEIDLNQRVGEWASIQETGKSLVPLFGPGYTGMVNLGNSCYLNSVMQVLFTLPEFQQRFTNLNNNLKKTTFIKEIFRYFQEAETVFDAADVNAYQDFNVQM